MEKDIVKAFELSKSKIRNKLKNTKQNKYSEYKKLLCICLDKINLNLKDKLDTKKIEEIDFGDYQGTYIYVFPVKTYQPTLEETFYTSVSYGSCSGCDTIQSIHNYNDDDIPNERQLDEYIELCLHLIQNIKRMKSIT